MTDVVSHTDHVGALRYKLVLGKYPVVRVEQIAGGFAFVIQFPNGVKMIVNSPTDADVREGDLLTLYTEVLAHAKPR